MTVCSLHSYTIKLTRHRCGPSLVLRTESQRELNMLRFQRFNQEEMFQNYINILDNKRFKGKLGKNGP